VGFLAGYTSALSPLFRPELKLFADIFRATVTADYGRFEYKLAVDENPKAWPVFAFTTESNRLAHELGF
jgi:hypothetical protein